VSRPENNELVSELAFDDAHGGARELVGTVERSLAVVGLAVQGG